MLNVPKIHFDSVPNLCGFSMSNIPKDHYGWICARGGFTSDDPIFYRMIEEITKIFFRCNNAIINLNYVSNFLVLIHVDNSADVYFGDLPLLIEYRSKKQIKKDDIVFENDIADIKRLRFSEIDILDTDKIICCLKVRWKFGLFFNLIPKEKWDLDLLSISLGDLYRRLEFDYVYKIIEDRNIFDELKKKGWFPFIELIGNEIKLIGRSFEDNFNLEETLINIVKSFNKERIHRISEKWWEKKVFSDKRKLLEAGLNAFLQNNNSGNINCLKTLLTEIEGVIRAEYRYNIGNDYPKNTDVFTTIINQNMKTESEYSLFLPIQFLEYLKEIIFCNFDIKDNDIEISKHSATHAVVDQKKYTREKALQTILCLDQIYYYLNKKRASKNRAPTKP